MSDEDDRLRPGMAVAEPAADDIDARKWRASVAARLFGGSEAEQRIGRHTILERLGAGSTGVVYAAFDPELDRKVALKLLHTGGGSERARASLVREAKTLAKLSHPNVLPVYDVGTHDDQLFVTLELVDGRTLRAWLVEAHALAEILDVFAQAARGLAAAHEAGVVHRDFKPENVLIGNEGRVRVSDFGIARRVSADAPEDALSTTPGGAGEDGVATTASLAGTPAYMAPEQFLGDPVDGRADQFAWCVALHEALYGRRPFAGSTRAELAASTIAGRRTIPRTADPPPAWLERILVRGLAVRPEGRFADMRALLAELERKPSRLRPLGIVTIGVGLGAMVALPLAAGDDELDACADTRSQIDGVWNESEAARVRDAFARSEIGWAGDTALRVERTIARWADGWADAATRACAGEPSPTELVGRTHCLQSRLLELRSLVELFADADAEVIEHAVPAADALRDPAECLFVAQAAADDSAGAVARGEIQLAIARAKALGDTGRPREALPIARAAIRDAQDHDDHALEAEALVVAGSLERHLIGVDDDVDAAATVHTAVLAAEAAHRPDLLARALVEYLGVLVRLGQFSRVDAWAERARAAVESVGAPDELMAEIDLELGMALGVQGHSAEAEAHALAALGRLSHEGASVSLLAATLNTLGEFAFDQGRVDEAMRYYERSLAVAIDGLGARHVWAANAHGNMAEVYFIAGRYDAAEEHFAAALDIRREVFGEDSLWVVHSLAHLGDVALLRGRPAEALALYERGMAARGRLADARRDGELPSVYQDLQEWAQDAWLENGIAAALVGLGRADEALAHAERTMDGDLPDAIEHPDLVPRIDMHAQVLLALGRAKEAEPELVVALARIERRYPPDAAVLAWPLIGLGRARVELGRGEEAIAVLERAIAILGAQPDATPRLQGDARFALARALGGSDPGRARELAIAARGDYARAADATAADREAVARWLAAAPR